MPRTCNCAGPCGPPQNDDEPDNGVSRRGFLTLLGTGVLAAAPVPVSASAETNAVAAPRRYTSNTHTDARFPLGGIGTGGFEMAVGGQFTTWQLWNTLRDGHVPFFFGIRVGKTAKLLQTTKGPVPNVACIRETEMTGEYPVATVRMRDTELPVEVTLTAFSPFSPLDEAISSFPTACFVFRLHNLTKKTQKVSLGAFLQNTIGYDAFGPVQSINTVGFNTVPERWSNSHPNFGGNQNTAISGKGWDGLLCTALKAVPGTVARPVQVYTNVSPAGLNTHPVDYPAGFSVRDVNELPHANTSEATGIIIWLENASVSLSASIMQAIAAAVEHGATLVWAGTDSPLLAAYARYTAGNVGEVAPDILFADFENGYGNWTVQGDAFGSVPATGTLPNQQTVSGFQGNGLVNSFRGGDDTKGKLTSKPFRIERNYLRFLVGGGSHTTTQVRLVVGGRTVRRQSGRDRESLEPALWNVAELKGQTAHIEIVDEQQGPWGHINADHFEWSDLPFPRDVAVLLGGLLPATLAAPSDAPASHAILFTKATPLAGARTGTSNRNPNVRFITHKVGAGQSILVSGSLLSTPNAELIGARQQAFAVLTDLAHIPYTPPQGVLANAPGWGSMAVAVGGNGQRSVCTTFDTWKDAWETFAQSGTLPASTASPMPTPPGQTVNGAVASTVSLRPGQSVEVPFYLTWHFPNRYNEIGHAVGNYYATLWKDAGAVMQKVASDVRLRARTERFVKAFYASSLPYTALDCLTSQISTIRHPGVVFRIANGDLYGWEGSNGCCPPTCTHVWAYEQTLAYLFPNLEREMRRIDFLHQQNADGGINNRTDVPSPSGKPTGEHPFADGHASSVLKFYREARNHGDTQYLPTHWPRVRAAVDYLINRDAATNPDKVPTGTLNDDQWNTYDNAIHGVNTFIGTYYLAALRAGEEMAKRVGDAKTATRYRDVFDKGRAALVERCWNGEYFEQHLPGYEQRAGEYGTGCLSDQLIGQWWAHQLDLGYLLPQEMVQSALRAIVKHNWLEDHTNFRHNWRKFAGGRDKGLLVCTWPRGGRPAQTIPYADEVWTGVEYQVAAHLAYEGMTREALTIVQGVRNRYNGVARAPIPRNPWNEIECGGHYARAMSSWSLLLALSGWDYDAPTQTLCVTPRPETSPVFRSFWSGPLGWGTLEQVRTNKGLRRMTLRVVEGHFDLTMLRCGQAGNRIQSARLQGTAQKTVAFSTEQDNLGRQQVRFAGTGMRLPAGGSLTVTSTFGT